MSAGHLEAWLGLEDLPPIWFTHRAVGWKPQFLATGASSWATWLFRASCSQRESSKRAMRRKFQCLLWPSLGRNTLNLPSYFYLLGASHSVHPTLKGRGINFHLLRGRVSRICGYVLKPPQSAFWYQIIYIPPTYKICSLSQGPSKVSSHFSINQLRVENSAVLEVGELSSPCGVFKDYSKVAVATTLRGRRN